MIRSMIALSLAAVDCVVCLTLGLPLVVAVGVACVAFAIATVALSVVSSSEDHDRRYGGAAAYGEGLVEPEVFRTT